MHRSWFFPARRTHTVDTKGVLVALAFLIGIMLLASGRGDKSLDHQTGQDTAFEQGKIRLTAETMSTDRAMQPSRLARR